MAITNDMLLEMVRFVRNTYKSDIGDKSFLFLGKQEMHLHEAMLDVLEESDLIDDKGKFTVKELEDSVLFFKALGFKEVHALDVSDYEHADIIFNLNDKLPPNLEEKFDIVFDGGVIEHVFDVTNALLNICKLTKIGGYIFNMNPCYNYIHNTFWNISPELFLDFYSANDYKVLDCRIITFMSENEETRAWAERPVTWSPDARLMNFHDVLFTGKYLRTLNKLCSNPNPHTWIVAKKTHSGEFIYPIVSGYAAKHKGGKEDNTNRTMKVRKKYNVEKVVQWVSGRERVSLYCVGDDFEKIMKALYLNNLESKVEKVFDSDINKFGSCIMGKKVLYLNKNTYSEIDEILICNEKNADEIYRKICDAVGTSKKIYKLTDSIFA